MAPDVEQLRYPVTFTRTPEGGIRAEFDNIPDCACIGPNPEVALRGLVAAASAYLGVALTPTGIEEAG